MRGRNYTRSMASRPSDGRKRLRQYRKLSWSWRSEERRTQWADRSAATEPPRGTPSQRCDTQCAEGITGNGATSGASGRRYCAYLVRAALEPGRRCSSVALHAFSWRLDWAILVKRYTRVLPTRTSVGSGALRWWPNSNDRQADYLEDL